MRCIEATAKEKRRIMQSRVTKEEIENLLTAEELATRFNCDPMHIYRLAWANRLPSVKIGRLRRFAPAAIAAMLAEGGTLDQAG
jgi:excisionase family DNA binding protein